MALRVLHLTPELPYAPGGAGGMTRQFHLLTRLMELGHEVTVVAPVAPGQEEAVEILRASGVNLTGVRRRGSAAPELLNAALRRPSLITAGAQIPVSAWKAAVIWELLRPVVRRELARARPDVVVVEHDSAAGWARDLPAGLPRVLTCHNASWAYYAMRAELRSGPAHALLRRESERFEEYVEQHLDRYSAVVAVSEPDRLRVASLTHVPCHVVPNGAPTDALVPQPEIPGAATVLFTGTMDHPPNADGARWFTQEIWPRVRRALPDARLVIVGRAPSRKVLALGNLPGVEVTGPVPAVGPYFERATVVIAPIRSGSGTRIKILEAFAAGRAVVSTAVGIEGIEAVPGRHALVTDDAPGFAGAVVALLREPAQRERLARDARTLVEERYDWRSAGDRLSEILHSVLRAP